MTQPNTYHASTLIGWHPFLCAIAL